MRATLRGLFATWGRPGRLWVDNGAPWDSWSDLPTDLALWEIGLGVAVHHNRPRRCRKNGRVERTHGVLAAWAEPAACADPSALQAALTAASRCQRERSPAIRGQSRTVAFPALAAGGRPYDPAPKEDLFDERRVWSRRVDQVGRISLYNRAVGVGRAWAGHEVAVRCEAEPVAWVVADGRGQEIARHAAPELSHARLLALAVSHRPPRPPAGQTSRPRRRGPTLQPLTQPAPSAWPTALPCQPRQRRPPAWSHHELGRSGPPSLSAPFQNRWLGEGSPLHDAQARLVSHQLIVNRST